jgi:adenosine deaminase
MKNPGAGLASASNISAFDVRKFATDERYSAHFQPSPRVVNSGAGAIESDLHTHLAGHLEFESLVKIAKEKNIEYPTSLLDKLKVKYPQNAVTNGRIPFRSLVESKEFAASNGLAALHDAMTIEKSRIRTFADMEEKYVYRGPITKDLGSFKEMLWEVAKSSKKSGVRYTEQSISNILDPEWLKIANDEVPKIEAALGVKIRFIAGLWRHSDAEWNLDEITRLKRVARSSPYVVGVDFMGHETNTTKELEPQIRAAADLRKEFGPEFQVRVHAGENPLNPGNVREAAEFGASRVGHGLYIEKDAAALKLDPQTQKLDEKVLAVLKEKGTLIELNPLSNQALNNLSGGESILLEQFKQFRAAGIPVVLGTDGIGMYAADHAETVRMLRKLGFKDDDFQYVRKSEADYVARSNAAIERRSAEIKAAGEKIPSREVVNEFVKQQGQHYTDELAKTRAAEKKAIASNFQTDFAQKNIVPYEFSDFKGMKAIDVSGGSQSQFATLEKEGRMAELKEDEIRKLFRELLVKLDPEKAFFLTGGTQFGVEKMLHEEVKRFNDLSSAKKFKIVGVLPEAANASEVFGPAKGGISHYLLGGKGWSDFARYKLDVLLQHGGAKMAIAGKMFVADEFRQLINSKLPIDVMYMDGPVGAGTDLARENPKGAFKDADGFLKKLSSTDVSKMVNQENIGGLAALKNRLATQKESSAARVEDGRALRVPATKAELRVPSRSGQCFVDGLKSLLGD